MSNKYQYTIAPAYPGGASPWNGFSADASLIQGAIFVGDPENNSAKNMGANLVAPVSYSNNGTNMVAAILSSSQLYNVPLFLDGLDSYNQTAQMVSNAPMVFDPVNDLWMPVFGTEETTAFAEQTLATGTGTATLGTLQNTRDRDGFTLSFVIADMAPGDVIQIKLVAGTGTYTMLVTGLIGQDGTYTVKVHPGLQAQPGLVANDQAPRTTTITCFYNVAGDVTVNCNVNWFN